MLLETDTVALPAPSWAEVEEIVSSLGPRGHGFAILSHRERGYVQAAGARLRMTVELRLYDTAGDFRHFVLGRAFSAHKETSINTAAGRIRVNSNEVLTARHALLIFRSFFDDAALPADYVLRETTLMFKE
jgi:hypothetical protein